MYQLHKEVLQVLENNGFISYIVGGAVRNKLLGLPIKDYDIVTQATPEEVLNVFSLEEAKYNIDLIGAHFGVALIKDVFGNSLEIASMRSEGVYSDSRHPDKVKYTKRIKEDLLRRDFTINALVEDQNGKIHDILGKGFVDLLTNKLINCIGNPRDRFNEDALRILRAIRLQSQTGFDIGKDTYEAMFDLRFKVINLSVERIREELDKVLIGEFRAKAIRTLLKLDILDTIFCIDKSNQCFISKSKIDEVCDCISKLPSITYALTVLLHFAGFSHTNPSNFLQTLKYSNEVIKTVEANFKALYEFPNVTKMRRAELKKFVRQDNFNQILELQAALYPNIKSPIFNSLINVVIRLLNEKNLDLWPQPLINGDGLIELGFKPGPIFKKIIDEVEWQQLQYDNKFTKEMAIELAKVMYEKG